MKYGILGTGDVAHIIATKLTELGHEVMMGARCATNERAVNWARTIGGRACHGTFADAAQFGERVFNCVQGIHSLEVLNAAGKEKEAQKFLPNTKVVKTLNYLCNHLMVRPQQLSEAITGFYCGNDTDAKAEVEALLKDFGWEDTLDLGNISMSRYTEMLGTFWVAALSATGNMDWGIKLVR